MGRSIIIVGDFNTSLSIVERTTRQKTRQNIEELNNIINQEDLFDFYRTFHPITVKCIF